MNRRLWTDREVALLKRLYLDTSSSRLRKIFRRPITKIYQAAARHGLKKSDAFMARKHAAEKRRLQKYGAAHRFPKGHVPLNKGLRRPGWAPGRMRETQFRKGHFPFNRDPDFYVIGALRVNSDGYVEMRVSFEHGAKGWRALHRILWQDAHGPIPPGHIVVFRDRDRLNVGLENLELITHAENCRRNSIHRLPPQLRDIIQLIGQVNRRINEKERARFA